MASRERPADRGARLGRAALERLGAEFRHARIDRGLSLGEIADACGISKAEASRIERALSPRVSYLTLARYAAVVELDLVSRTYAGPVPVRDRAHLELLADFVALLGPGLQFAGEVPLPIPGDQRAWDGMVIGPDWRFGVEAETAPHDVQALARRLALKVRDGQVDGLFLVVRESDHVRAFLAEAAPHLRSLCPIPARSALRSLRLGERPAGGAVLAVHRRRQPREQPGGGPRAS